MLTSPVIRSLRLTRQTASLPIHVLLLTSARLDAVGTGSASNMSPSEPNVFFLYLPVKLFQPLSAENIKRQTS